MRVVERVDQFGLDLLELELGFEHVGMLHERQHIVQKVHRDQCFEIAQLLAQHLQTDHFKHGVLQSLVLSLLVQIHELVIH